MTMVFSFLGTVRLSSFSPKKNREENRKYDIIHVETVKWPVDDWFGLMGRNGGPEIAEKREVVIKVVIKYF